MDGETNELGGKNVLPYAEQIARIRDAIPRIRRIWNSTNKGSRRLAVAEIRALIHSTFESDLELGEVLAIMSWRDCEQVTLKETKSLLEFSREWPPIHTLSHWVLRLEEKKTYRVAAAIIAMDRAGIDLRDTLPALDAVGGIKGAASGVKTLEKFLKKRKKSKKRCDSRA